MCKEVPIVFISDNDYVLPTTVAIKSLVLNKKETTSYKIYIIASDISQDNKELFKRFESDMVSVEIIEQNCNEFNHLHTFDENSICVASIAALLKFLIPQIIADYEKVLYLDGDILIRGDLSELYNTDISGYMAGVIIDSGSIYYRHEYVNKVDKYFNSGVMLLNLETMRREKTTESLIKCKQDINDSNLMDQNVFNIVFNKRIKTLSIRYNFLAANLNRADSKWGINQINEIYNTSYENKSELFEDSLIVHFSSKDKPWKVSNVSFADEWYEYYLLNTSGIENSSIKRYTKDMDNKLGIKVSVIIPVYNVEKYLEDALKSVLRQTLAEIEVICIDDGSTDRSGEILKEFQLKDNRIIIISQENQGQSVARNKGMEIAKGKYFYFMDSDDYLASDGLEKMYLEAENEYLDIVLFDGSTFFESPGLEEKYSNFKNNYIRKKRYEGVYNGKSLFLKMMENWDYKVSVVLQFFRADFLLLNKIYFKEGIIHEDNLFSFLAIIKARRVKHLSESLYYRRMRENSVMTKTVNANNFIGYYVCTYEIIKLANSMENSIEEQFAINRQIYSYLKKLKEIYDESLSEEEKAIVRKDDRIKKFSYEMLLDGYCDVNEVYRLKSKCERLERENIRLIGENKKIRAKIKKMRESFTFRIGKIFMYIPRKIKKILVH